MITHYDTKRKNLVTDRDTTTIAYINSFELYVQKLENLEGDWSDDKKIREFTGNIDDEDYDTEYWVHTGTFEDLVKAIYKCEQDLEKKDATPTQRQRRFQRETNEDDSKSK